MRALERAADFSPSENQWVKQYGQGDLENLITKSRMEKDQPPRIGDMVRAYYSPIGGVGKVLEKVEKEFKTGLGEEEYLSRLWMAQSGGKPWPSFLPLDRRPRQFKEKDPSLAYLEDTEHYRDMKLAMLNGYSLHEINSIDFSQLKLPSPTELTDLRRENQHWVPPSDTLPMAHLGEMFGFELKDDTGTMRGDLTRFSEYIEAMQFSNKFAFPDVEAFVKGWMVPQLGKHAPESLEYNTLQNRGPGTLEFPRPCE